MPVSNPISKSSAVDGTRLAIGAALAIGLGTAGTALVSTAEIAFPGAVVGLVLLAFLMRLPTVAEGVGALFDRVAPHMILFFVPAGSGIVAEAHSLAADWMVVGAVVLLGTPASVAAVALAAHAILDRRTGRDGMPLS